MKIIIAIFAGLFVLVGCASQVTQESVAVSCPKNMGELDVLKTESQVVKCLGESEHNTSKPDGRHTRLYRFEDGVMVVFLFDKKGAVIRNRAYQDTLAK